MKIISDQQILKNILSNDGIVFLPSDTIRGISCLATSTKAILDINSIKQRDDNKTMIILISDDLYNKYVNINNFVSEFKYPTTIIYNYDDLTSFGRQNISSKLIRDNHTLAIRKVSNTKLDDLITYLWVPIVSTSINISGHPYTNSIENVSKDIAKKVDGIHKIKNRHPRRSPSHIVRITNGEINYIRK